MAHFCEDTLTRPVFSRVINPSPAAGLKSSASVAPWRCCSTLLVLKTNLTAGSRWQTPADTFTERCRLSPGVCVRLPGSWKIKPHVSFVARQCTLQLRPRFRNRASDMHQNEKAKQSFSSASMCEDVPQVGPQFSFEENATGPVNLVNQQKKKTHNHLR